MVEENRAAKRLTLCNFPTPFDGEVAYFELGLHRVSHPLAPGWEGVDVALVQTGVDKQAQAILETHPDAILIHVYRDRVQEALALANALGALDPGPALIWSGWTAHAEYLKAVSQATLPITHPRLLLACGEVEAVVPVLLQRIAHGAINLQDVTGSLPATAWFDSQVGQWKGQGLFAQVADVSSLGPVWDTPTAVRVHPGGAGWIEVSRGCKYACSFCVACSMGEGSVRPHLPERIRAEIAAAASKGVKLFGLLASAINYDVESLRAVAESIRAHGPSDCRVAGTVHAKFAQGERLDRMASMKWETMIVGLQTTTPEAQRLMRRREERDLFAAAVERLRALCVPEVELILGLPGDTAEGFEQSVRFALSLPVSVSVYRLRLDPWSKFLEQRAELGLEGDFARLGRVCALPGFCADEINAAGAWLQSLARGPWHHRAQRLLFDGVPIYPSSR
jgi:hypothetical protein